MMKKTNHAAPLGRWSTRWLLAPALLLGSMTVQAQAPAWQSAEAVGRSNRVTATATDERGAVFVTGTFDGTLTLGSTTLTSAGNTDIFVAKRNGLTGVYEWAYRAGGAGPDSPSSLAVVHGTVYIGGGFGSATADFGATTLTGPGGTSGVQRAFVAKLADRGTINQGFKWAVQGTSTLGSQQVNGLAVRDSTSVYAVGQFTGAALGLGSTALLNADPVRDDVFVAKVTDAGFTGSFAWAVRAGGLDDDRALAVATSATGVYVVGDFYSDTAFFGATALGNSFPGQGGTDLFVARVDDAGATGSFAWATASYGTGSESPTSVAVAGSVVYVGGTYTAAGTAFGPTSLPNTGGDDGYVARLNDTGTAGDFAWAAPVNGPSGEAVTAVAVGNRGLYIGGQYNSATATFGSFSLTSPSGTGDGFVARLTDNTTSGSFAWVQATGGYGDDVPRALAPSGGRLWVGGAIGAAPAQFGTHPVAPANPNGTTGFLALLVDGQPDLNVRVGSTTYFSGSTYDFGSVPVGSSSGLQTFTIENLGTADVLALFDFNFAGGLGGSYGYPTPTYNVGAGGSTFFTTSVRPTALGVQTGSVTIYSDDPDEPGYVVNFRVTGTAPAAVTWTGAVSTDWATPGNWNPAQLPGATTDVTIPITARQPLVSAAGATCASLSSVVGTTLTIAGVGYLTVANDYQANGTTTMTGGTLESTALSTYFNGGLNATGGTVLLSGSSLQEAGTNGGNCTFWNLTVAARSGNGRLRPYGGNISVRRVLTLGADIESGGGPNVTLLSDANGTAMVVNQGGRVSSGTMQRYVGGPNAGLGYRHFSSPGFFTAAGVFYGQGFAPVLNAAYNTTGNTVRPFPTFFGYDEARQGAAGVPGAAGFDQGWYSPATANDPLSSNRGNGRGATVQVMGGSTVSASSFFNTGPVAVGALSRSGSGAFAGYHLLGNPYPSPIDWDNVAKPAGLDNAVYVFRSTSQYGGFYDEYVNGMGTLPGGEIAAMQGFFVRVSQPVPSFTFTDAARLTTYSNPTFRRGAADVRPVLALALHPAAGGEADKAFVYFEAGATAAYDGRYDAAKLPNSSGLNLASQLGTAEYAVNGLPVLSNQPLLLPLTVQVPAAGSYELATEQLVNFVPGTALYLRDALRGTLTPLTAGSRYVFSLAGTTAPGRFSIEFRPTGALATAAQVLAAQVQVYPNPAKAGAASVTVVAPAGATVTVLNALGQTVHPVALLARDGIGRHLTTTGLAAGVYIIQVLARDAAYTQRLILE